MSSLRLTRRRFLHLSAAGATLASVVGPSPVSAAAAPAKSAAFKLRFVLSTNLYGTLPIAEILPEVKRAGCEGLDVWAGRWGNQREQIDAMGHDAFAALLATHQVRVSTYTCMDPGFLKAGPHLKPMKAFGGNMVVAGFGGGGPGANRLRGDDLRRAIRAQVERLKPAFDLAGEQGVKLAIENHLNSLLETPDSLPMLVDALPASHVGVAFAPFHLPQEAALLGRLVGDLGERLFYYYAWQYGDGSGNLPPAAQKRQLPGVGPLDFTPMLAALKRHRFNGWTSIFMHPTPRGSPLHPTIPAVTAELNRARAHLDGLTAVL